MKEISIKQFPSISLKAARVNAGLSQNQAAEKLGVNVITIQNWESGKTVPDILHVRHIEKVYNFPHDYIFFGNNHALSVGYNETQE